MRCVQPEGDRGSLKWIQRAVECNSEELEKPILAALPEATRIDWKSPIRADDFAGYRDKSFLEKVGVPHLENALASFWPARGPQWDALAITDASQVILVEAKAHIGEFCSPASQASPRSLELIKRALLETAKGMGVPLADAENWHDRFFQYTNRLAHLYLLRSQGVDAWLIFVGFTDDDDMPGSTTAEAWEAAYKIADYALGISSRHALRRYVIHVHPSVSAIP